MAEPERDHGGVDAGVEESHGGGVPQRVRGDLFADERRAGDRGSGRGVSDASLDRISAQSAPGDGGEQRGVDLPPCSSAQARTMVTVAATSGVQRSLRPLPRQ